MPLGFWEVLVIGLVLSAASIAVGELLRPKQRIEDAKPGDLGDINFPTTTEDRVKPIVFGRNLQEGYNTMWTGDFRQKKIKKKIKNGIIQSQTVVTGFRYFVGFQAGICLGPVGGVRRVWIGNKVVYDGPAVADGTIEINEPNLFGGIDKGSGGVVGTLRIVPGTQTQTVPAYLVPFQQPSYPYRDQCYALWEGGEIGTTTSMRPWKFEIERFPNTLGITGDEEASAVRIVDDGTGYLEDEILTLEGGTFTTPATFVVLETDGTNVAKLRIVDRGQYSVAPVGELTTTSSGIGINCTVNVDFFGPHVVNGGDSNPAEVIHEYLTNTDWGRGRPSADIDVPNFLAAAATLHAEGQGFAMIIDRALEGSDFLDQIEQQIDGKVLFDMEFGKFTITLSRGGYDPVTIPQLTDVGPEKNLLEVQKFDDALFSSTINEVHVKFTDRKRDYFKTSASADSLSNLRIQGVRSATEVRYPGCKDRTLANKLASRGIRVGSVPLKSATFIADRSFWNIRPVDVIAWTDSKRGFSRLPMRVTDVDVGELGRGKVKIQAVQDVFGFSQAIFGDPIDTLWEIPTQPVAPLPAADQVVIEAPYALARRDPDADLGVSLDRLWCGGRPVTGAEVSYLIFQRNAVGVPAGPYVQNGEVPDFFLAGQLRTALDVTGLGPGLESIEINGTPDSLADMLDEFISNSTPADLGQNFINVLYVNGEWMAFRTISNQGTHLLLTDGYRAFMDSTPIAHLVNERVFLAFVGGALSTSILPQTNNVDVQLRGSSRSDVVSEADAITVQLTLDNIGRRAIIPVEPTFNGLRYRDPVDVDDIRPGGSGLDAAGIDTTYRRRDFRVLDEVESLSDDAETFVADFPANNTHENQTTIDELDETLTTGAAASWKLEEADNTTREDSSPNNIDLLDTSNVAQLPVGKIGAAATFDGAADFLEVASSGSLDPGDSDFSIAGWVRFNSKAGTQIILSKSNTLGSQISYLLYYFDSLDQISWAMSSSGNTGAGFNEIFNSKFTPLVGEWFFFYVEYDSVLDRLRSRFNNEQYDQIAHASGAFQGTAKFQLATAKDGAGVNANFFNGDLDAITFWDRKLTETEQGLYFFGTVGQEWPFPGRRTAFQLPWQATANPFASRTILLQNLNGSLPDTDLKSLIEARHTFSGQVFEARHTLEHSYDLAASDLDTLDSLGLVRSNEVSPVHVTDSTGTYQFEIGTALDGVVQARLNGGAFTTVIAIGETTGTLASVTAGDDMEVRHATDAAPDQTLLLIRNPSVVDKAYAVLTRQTTPVRANLGAYYRLNEGTTGAAVDAQVNGLNLVQSAGSIGSKTDGKIGLARGIYASGAHHQRSSTVNDTFDLTNGAVAVSFFGFMWLDTFTTDQTICAIWNSTIANQGFFFRAQIGVNDVVFGMGDGAGGSSANGSGIAALATGEWIAVGFSYDPVTNTAYVYAKRDGEDSAFSAFTPSPAGFQNSNRFQFSLGGANSGLLSLDGFLDACGWWKGRTLQKPQFDWLAEGHDIDDFDEIP